MLCVANYFKNVGALYCNDAQLYFIATHVALSSFFSVAALIDITAYDTTNDTTCVVYTFTVGNMYKLFLITVHNKQLNTIADLFKNALWFEREVREMFGVNFLNSTDCRNLLLPYAYFKNPLKKITRAQPSSAIRFEKSNDALV